jgi:hypothetical protein
MDIHENFQRMNGPARAAGGSLTIPPAHLVGAEEVIE